MTVVVSTCSFAWLCQTQNSLNLEDKIFLFKKILYKAYLLHKINSLLIVSSFSFNFNRCSGCFSDMEIIALCQFSTVMNFFLFSWLWHCAWFMYKPFPHGNIWVLVKCTTLTDICTLEMWSVRSKYKVDIMRFCNKKNNCQITQSQLGWLRAYWHFFGGTLLRM